MSLELSIFLDLRYTTNWTRVSYTMIKKSYRSTSQNDGPMDASLLYLRHNYYHPKISITAK